MTSLTQALTLSTLLLASACSGTHASRTGNGAIDQAGATPPTSELALHDGEFCPHVLPRAPRETYGFGTEASASSGPELKSPREAWVCTYGAKDVSSRGDNGAWYEWVLGEAHRLDAEELSAFTEAAKGLVPRSASQMCTDELGPRYMVSFVSAEDLTGVVIDGYGCGDVRLTDEPFVTVPGDASQSGIVSGVLSGSRALLESVSAD
jgi:hypothetical protein